jgi:4-hydroxy-4-methyl-2-oxoglutarate aldolase
MVQSGDIIVADLDGISVVDPSRFEAVSEAARQLAAKEAEMLRRIADGSTTMDLLRLTEHRPRGETEGGTEAGH